MKIKRLDRDAWGFWAFPYYQMRVDFEDFHGLVGLIRLIGEGDQFWHMPRAGKVQVCGKGMVWIEIVPDRCCHAVTAKCVPIPKKIGGTVYPYTVSVWYADVIDGLLYNDDHVAAFRDAYIDVIFTPKGDIKIDDRDELDAAHRSGELSDEQYALALKESENIMTRYCGDLRKTEHFFARLLNHVLQRIEDGEKPLVRKQA